SNASAAGSYDAASQVNARPMPSSEASACAGLRDNTHTSSSLPTRWRQRALPINPVAPLINTRIASPLPHATSGATHDVQDCPRPCASPEQLQGRSWLKLFNLCVFRATDPRREWRLGSGVLSLGRDLALGMAVEGGG